MPQTLKEHLQSLIQLVSNSTDAFTAALFLLDEKDPGELFLYAHQTLSLSLDENVRIPVGHGLVGWVAKNDQPTFAHSFDKDTRSTLRFYTKDEDIKSFAATPVRCNGRLVGVLVVDSKKSYLFTDKMIKLLNEFAAVISHVRSGGKMRIKSDRNASSFDALYNMIDRVTVCTSIAALSQTLRLHLPELVPHDSLAFATLAPNGRNFHLVQMADGENAHVPLPLSPWRMGMVIQHGATIYVPDVGEAPLYPGCEGRYRSFMGVPIIAHNEVVGSLALLALRPKAFSRRDEKSLCVVAAACASAFTSLYLHNKDKMGRLLDPLTRLYNHHYLLETRPTVEKNASVGVVNLVGFTRINQRLGHQGGDTALLETAKRLQRVIDEDDLLCRYYGDRFLLYLHGRKKKAVQNIFAKAADAIESHPYHCAGMEIHITPAIGVAYAEGQGQEVDELISRAFSASEKAANTAGVSVAEHGESSGPTPLQRVT